MFLDELSEDEIHTVLQQCLLHVEQSLTELVAAPDHNQLRGVDLAIAHRKALLQAEHTWLEKIITSPEIISTLLRQVTQTPALHAVARDAVESSQE